MQQDSKDDIDIEMTCALRRAGIHVPPERWAAMRHAYLSYQDVAKVLDEPLAYESEPAGIYRLDSVAEEGSR